MQKPILVVMAAGMGSRYGGLKQIDPVGKNGEIIMDFSVFDALRAGFSKDGLYQSRRSFTRISARSWATALQSTCRLNMRSKSSRTCRRALRSRRGA